MADVFISYARADDERAATLVQALTAGGRSLWWDRHLASGADYARVIEHEIDAARSVIVAWSASARESLWVRAEANAALDQGKLVQINLDRARLPLPFTMLHFLDFSAWSGGRDQTPLPELERALDEQTGTSRADDQPGRRPDPGGVPFLAQPERALQGLERVAMLGWAAIGAAIVLALATVAVARGSMAASAFGVISLLALAIALAAFGGAAFFLYRTMQASRR